VIGGRADFETGREGHEIKKQRERNEKKRENEEK
jgi:hypothetical protein